MDEIRQQIERYKEGLRKGLSCIGERGSGRTQAIIEFAYERIQKGEQVAVLCGDWPNSIPATLARYIETFGEALPRPRFIKSLDELRGVATTHVLSDRT